MFPCNIGGHAAYQDFGLTEIFHFYPDPLCWNVIPNMGLLQEFLPACFVPACYPLNLRVRRYDRRLNIICRECRKSEVMQRVLAFYQNGFRERLGDQG